MGDRLIDALKAEWSDQPDKPQYQTGTGRDGEILYVGVDRVSTPDTPTGLECARAPLSGGRIYMITFRRDIAVWLISALGAALTDNEWERAVDAREDELALREEEATDER